VSVHDDQHDRRRAVSGPALSLAPIENPRGDDGRGRSALRMQDIV